MEDTTSANDDEIPVMTGSKRPRTSQGSCGGFDVELRHREISSSMRHFPPAHCTMKVQSYSFLSKSEKYISRVFKVDGYKWRLWFYPNGDKQNNGADYISLYLELVERHELPGDWEVNVNFKLFVYNQLEDSYLTIKDAVGAVKRFHKMKTKRGFAQLLPLKIFKDPSNGYLVDDSCIFGAEVFVLKQTGNWESVSIVKGPSISYPTFTWKIEDFSMLEEAWLSEDFTSGGTDEWMLIICPEGEFEERGKSLKLVLCLCDTRSAVYANYKLRVLDQLNGEHCEETGRNWFFPWEEGSCVEYPKFMSLKDLHKPSNGFIVNDTLIVEVEFLVVSETKGFFGNQQ